LVLIKKGIISKPKHPGISIQIGAEVYTFDAIRGESVPNFEPNEGLPEDYIVEDSGDEENEDS
jgi:hypothetical protein